MVSPSYPSAKTISASLHESPQQLLVQKRNRWSFLQKVVRIALAVLVVIMTLGLILFFYTFSEITTFPWCCRKHLLPKEDIIYPLASPSPSLQHLPSIHEEKAPAPKTPELLKAKPYISTYPLLESINTKESLVPIISEKVVLTGWMISPRSDAQWN
ncbi:hypothetical protein FTN42_01470 [Chlamydia trachomatis]|nr:hypothetical protein FTN61_01470 [Chlamydia trachomatis]UFT84832.1 hypothetical protein FTN42_01470 [Chlamydia trachomatis]